MVTNLQDKIKMIIESVEARIAKTKSNKNSKWVLRICVCVCGFTILSIIHDLIILSII